MSVNTTVSSAPTTMNGTKRYPYPKWSAFPGGGFCCGLAQLHGSPVRLKRSVASNEAIGCIELDIRVAKFRVRIDLQEVLSDQLNSLRGCRGFELPLKGKFRCHGTSCPTNYNGFQKQSSCSQEAHMRTSNWAVESCLSISTRVRWSVPESTFSHLPIRLSILVIRLSGYSDKLALMRPQETLSTAVPSVPSAPRRIPLAHRSDSPG